MRINFTPATLVLSMAIICLSCSKSAQQNLVLSPASASSRTIQEVDATVTPDGLYELFVNAGKVEIHKQALHFEHSIIGQDSENGLKRYRYVPAKGFTGTDEVTLSETNLISTGGGCDYDGEMNSRSVKTTTFTKIKFTVK